MTALECVYFVSTGKCYAEVHPCQKQKDKPAENKRDDTPGDALAC